MSAVLSREGTLPSKLELGLMALAMLFMYAPTYMKLSEETWSQEGQGHGPVMLALAIWLFWQRLSQWDLPKQPGSWVLGLPVLLVGMLLYTVGRSQDFPEFEVLSQVFVLGGMLILYAGWRYALKLWFPFVFILVLVPLPGSVVYTLTAPLKAGVSYVAEALLYNAGYPIGRTGVTLTIGSYQLLVADACAGLNSIFALEAIGVFYMSVVQHKEKIRNVLLALLILPISFISNVVRVIVLVLVTYYFGDEAGQGFVHGFAGILLFMIATALTIGTDSLIGLFFPNPSKGEASAKST